MAELLQAWTALSDTVKGAVIGAGVAASVGVLSAIVAFLGVVVNGFISRKNLAQQLAHDRDQKAGERRLALRRDIYLGVAQYIQDALSVLLELGDINRTEPQIMEAMRKSQHFVAKLHLMAQGDLLTAVSELTAAYSEALVAQRAGRIKIQRGLDALKALRSRIDWHRGNASQIVETLKAKTLAGTNSAEESDRLSKIHQFEYTEAERLAKLHDEQLVRWRRDLADHGASGMAAYRKVLPLVVPVVAAARKELGEEFDVAAYTRALQFRYTPSKEDMLKLYGLDEESVRILLQQPNPTALAESETTPPNLQG